MESRIKCIHLCKKIAFTEENGTNSSYGEKCHFKAYFWDQNVELFHTIYELFSYSNSTTFSSQRGFSFFLFSHWKHWQLITPINREIVRTRLKLPRYKHHIKRSFVLLCIPEMLHQGTVLPKYFNSSSYITQY